jgi:hypothetical protein
MIGSLIKKSARLLKWWTWSRMPWFLLVEPSTSLSGMFFVPPRAQPWLLLDALLRCLERTGSCADQNFYCLLHGQLLFSVLWNQCTLWCCSPVLFFCFGRSPLGGGDKGKSLWFITTWSPVRLLSLACLYCLQVCLRLALLYLQIIKIFLT